MKDLPWFRMYSEAVDDEKLRLLAFEDRWHFIALLCCKAKGVLDDGDDLMRRKVAVKLGLDLRALDEAARRLAEVGLIDEKTLQPLAWDDRQFRSDSSTERVRAYRERVKRFGNVTVTPQETDTDTDTDKEKDIKDVSRKARRSQQLPDDFFPDETSANLADELGLTAKDHLPQFFDYHRARGKPMKDWQAAFRTWLRNAKKWQKPETKERSKHWMAEMFEDERAAERRTEERRVIDANARRVD